MFFECLRAGSSNQNFFLESQAIPTVAAKTPMSFRDAPPAQVALEPRRNLSGKSNIENMGDSSRDVSGREMSREPSTSKNANGGVEFDKTRHVNATGVGVSPWGARKTVHHSHHGCIRRLGGPPLWPYGLLFVATNVIAGVLNALSGRGSAAYEFFGWSVYLSRAAAGVILCSGGGWILLTVCKHLFAYLRNQGYTHRLIPFDGRIISHMVIGYTIFIAAILHVIGHYFNVYKIAHGDPVELFALFGDKYGITPTSVPSYGETLFKPIWGWTGHLMFLILIIVMVTSLPKIRAKFYEVFWYTHHLVGLFFVLLLFHGSDALLSFPKFWAIVLLPGAIFLYETIYAFTRPERAIFVEECALLTDVTKVVIERPVGFHYLPGQYAMIKIPSMSKLQWHPFSFTSSPLDSRVLTFHIGMKGDYTTDLRKRLEKIVPAGNTHQRINSLYSVDEVCLHAYINSLTQALTL